jgi:hypothetical protein
VRVAVGKKLRVGPGDEIIIRGRLAPSAKLSRLYVFASEHGAEFSPYVLHVSDMLVANGRPTMLAPLSLRLSEHRSEHELSFVADIDGYICIMQEVDTPKDPRATVRVICKINPDLSWPAWAKRKFLPWLTPNPS